MALLDSEIKRIKAELGYPVENNLAEPYISIVAVFEQVVQEFTDGGAVTSSSTAVVAAATPTPVTIVLAGATGFTLMDRVVIDVDSRQETATLQNITGTSATLLLKKAHTGTYPVTVEGGESIVRELMQRIAAVKEELLQNYGAGALKAVDEISFYGTGDSTNFSILSDNLRYWRNELAGILGVDNMWEIRNGYNSALSVY